MKQKRSKGIKLISLVGAVIFLTFISSCSVDNKMADGGTEPETGVVNAVQGTRASGDFYKPTGLYVYLWLTKNPEPNYSAFTRIIRFEKSSSDYKDIYVYFTRNVSNPLLFVGEVIGDGLDKLASMTAFGARRYWDIMYFVNAGWISKLTVSRMSVLIQYNNLTLYGDEDTHTDNPDYTSDDFKNMEIARMNNFTLYGGGTFSVEVYRAGYSNEYYGRLLYLNNMMGTNYSYWALPNVLQWMIRDIGKSGSDPDGKYGQDTIGEMCSEAISWYYKTANIKYGTYNFENVVAVDDMTKVFRNNGRYYCFHLGLQRFQKVDVDGNWLKPYDSYKFTPQPGDYLARITSGNKHSMMIAKWDEARDEAWVLEGPHPVALRRVRVREMEQNGHDYAVGSIF